MDKIIHSRILLLIESIKSTFAQFKTADDSVNSEIQKVTALLKHIPTLTGEFTNNYHPVTGYLNALLQTGNSSTKTLLEKVSHVIYKLPWNYSYQVREDIPDLEQNIAFAEIIGPEAPFRSNSVCLGLTIIGPQTLYPNHHHPAVELYLVVAGTAVWTKEGVSNSYPPGTYILHPSQVNHSMQTFAEPLLAIYTWSGKDVFSKSEYTSPRLPQQERTKII